MAEWLAMLTVTITARVRFQSQSFFFVWIKSFTIHKLSFWIQFEFKTKLNFFFQLWGPSPLLTNGRAIHTSLNDLHTTCRRAAIDVEINLDIMAASRRRRRRKRGRRRRRRRRNRKRGKRDEKGSCFVGCWTLMMLLTFGCYPAPLQTIVTLTIVNLQNQRWWH